MSTPRKTKFVYVVIVVLASIGALGLWLDKNGDEGIFGSINSDNYLRLIKNRGDITFITRNAPTTYYQGKNGPEGIEYELAVSFAEFLGVTPRFIVKDSISEITNALNNGEGVVAAAGLTQTDGRAQHFLFGPNYQDVKQQVVCRRGNVIPRNKHDLAKVEILVSADTSYVETLQRLQSEIPILNWLATTEFDTEQLLEQVWKNELNCTIADSNIVAINRRYYPELLVAFDLSPPAPLSWLIPKDAFALQQQLHAWKEQMGQQGKIADAVERYYGYIELFDYVDNRKFQRRVKKRLPRYKQHFVTAAEKYNISWTLLAAQSYQESHWRPRAKSPTGVRGMMMLTLPTAKEMGVKSRLNARESIYGGARYFSKLLKRVPDSVAGPDRTWMALAAYNIGMGHIYDARTLAKQLGKNPDKWADLSDVLPLLAQKKYYKQLKYGYARGSEPVTYVTHIRDFKDLLDKQFSSNQDIKEKTS